MQPSVSNREASRVRQAIRKIAILLVALLAIGGVVSLFATGRATSELQLSRHRVESLTAQIRQLESENARLKNEIDSVKKSTYAVERIAREDLGMSRHGEVIYLTR